MKTCCSSLYLHSLHTHNKCLYLWSTVSGYKDWTQSTERDSMQPLDLSNIIQLFLFLFVQFSISLVSATFLKKAFICFQTVTVPSEKSKHKKWRKTSEAAVWEVEVSSLYLKQNSYLSVSQHFNLHKAVLENFFSTEQIFNGWSERTYRHILLYAYTKDVNYIYTHITIGVCTLTGKEGSGSSNRHGGR